MSVAALALAPAVFANEYGIGTEFNANYGSQVYRQEKSVACVGAGSGFVFNDLWQGIQADAGWIEVGTSYCDAGDPNAKWVWAYFSNGNYYESVIQRNIANFSTHTFKIWNYQDDDWRIYIDGNTKVTLFGYGVGSSGNSADVGLEVTARRMDSVQVAIYEDDLVAWSARNTSASWAGQDSCSDTDPDIYTRWINPDNWRHSLNHSLVSTC